MIHTGDCVEVMATMEPDSVDAVVTDPPYNLSFMGRNWDTFPTRKRGMGGTGYKSEWAGGVEFPSKVKDLHAFQAWCEAWGREALRVTKPGGYLLAFGGTRTHHRLVCGLEDAGWIIRDELDWVYASGFPKGKANLKPAHEPIVLARKPGPLRPLNIEESRIGTEQMGGYEVSAGGMLQPSRQRESGYRPKWDREDKGFVAHEATGRWPSNLLLSDPELFDEPNPYVVGSGATAGDFTQGRYHLPDRAAPDAMFAGGRLDAGNTYTDTGGYSRFFLIPKADRADREPVLRGQLDAKQVPFNGTSDHSAGLAPGSVEAKMTTSPRENAHPTVKPTDLMRHLIRLVTPSGGTVLDPFLGSGSTVIACELEGFEWVGIEKEESYVEIANARLNGVQKGLGLDVGAPSRRSVTPPRSKPSPVVRVDLELFPGVAGPTERDEVA